MKIETPRFGSLEFDEDRVIHFPEGLLGFPGQQRFLHVSPEDWDPIEFLIPIDEPRLAFPLMNPHLRRADYAFELDEAQSKSLLLGQGSGVLAYAVVTFGSSLEESTINMLAPVLINPAARRGRQIVLEDSGYEVAARLLSDSE